MLPKRIIHFVCVWILIYAVGVFADTFNIGILLDGPSQEQSGLLASVENEVLELTRGEFDVRFSADNLVSGDWSLASIQERMDSMFRDDHIDLIITMGYMASQYVCHLDSIPKPVIAPLIWDAGFQELPITGGVSGVVNLNYINVPVTFERDMNLFREIVGFQNLAVIGDQAFLSAFPEIRDRTTSFFKALGLDATLITIDPQTLLHLQISQGTEAVYVLPLEQLSVDGEKALANELIDKKLPSFAYKGTDQVEQGFLVGLNTDDYITRLSRRIALNIQRILLGDQPQEIPVTFSFDQQITFNMTTGQAIGVYPSWAVMTEARIIEMNKARPERSLNMTEAIREAVEVNLDLLARERYVTAGKEDVARARANLLPQIQVSATGVQIDQDRAKNSFGQQAERTLTGSVTASQVLFSEPAWANLGIQKDLQASRKQEYRQLKLDIIQCAGTAYLNVLSAKAYESIQQDNLKLTRRNLELARVREMVGSAGPAEVYRWESQIASNRNAVISANAQRNLAEIELNRILHRPAEESFNTMEVNINDPVMVTSQQDLGRYIENKQVFKIFRAFMAKEAIDKSPEIASLDAAIQAKERQLKSATRKFWAPTIALQGEYDHTFSRGGEGTDASIELPAGIPFDISFPEPKDNQWNVALNASLPLYSGGSRFAERKQAYEELHQLRLQREALAERIEQRIRSALHMMGASFASIKQAKLAAEAAEKSLNVAQDSYSLGVVSIVELLDAQNAALIANQSAATAVYNFFIKLMETERAFGDFFFMMDGEQRRMLEARANEYFRQNGISFDSNQGGQQ